MVRGLQHALQHVPEVFPIGSLSLMGFPSQPSAGILTNKFPNTEPRHQILLQLYVRATNGTRSERATTLDAGLRVL